MKASDLMIGDWVSYCGFYNKVIYIGQKVSMYNGKGTEFTTDPEYIRPIPLTEEILVKNGFDHQMPYDDYVFGEICLYESGNGYIVHGFVGLGGLSIHIDYVHQLQHLLRLVGVQKEIEL